MEYSKWQKNEKEKEKEIGALMIVASSACVCTVYVIVTPYIIYIQKQLHQINVIMIHFGVCVKC